MKLIDDRTVDQWRRRLAAGSTVREIAEQDGVNPSTVQRRVGPTGRRTGPRGLPLTAAQVAAAIAETGSIAGAAKQLGVSRTAVIARMERT